MVDGMAADATPRQRINTLFQPQSPPLRRRRPPSSLPSPAAAVLLLLLLAAVFIFFLELLVLSRSNPPPETCATASPASWDADLGPLPVRAAAGDHEFWRQPNGGGYIPCIEFGLEYRKESARIVREEMRFLMVVVTGGLNQQRNEIVDAVVIARVLGAALVMPVLQVNQIWGDQSEFSDVFDAEHFKKTLSSDVRVVSSVPYTHLRTRPAMGDQLPNNASPLWIKAKLQKSLKKHRILVLNGLDNKLSKDLPLDLQRLRCKVAYHALRCVGPVRELGNKIAKRMWERGPFVALHLRIEKDVWVRTGCSPALGEEYDAIVSSERKLRPDLLTGRLNMSYHQRKLAGLCPLTGQEVALLLISLGAPRDALIYRAGGEPFGGEAALRPIKEAFPNMMDKEMLAEEGELELFAGSSSAMAAIDYIVSLNSDVFLPSHGGNMARAIQGHRTYAGHRKSIKPNKRWMLPAALDGLAHSRSNAEVDELKLLSARKDGSNVEREAVEQPELRTEKKGRDVVAYPVPECMCRKGTGTSLPFFNK